MLRQIEIVSNVRMIIKWKYRRDFGFQIIITRFIKLKIFYIYKYVCVYNISILYKIINEYMNLKITQEKENELGQN